MIKGLLSFLEEKMPSLKQSYDDWPNPNQKLKFPALSVFTRNPKFVPMNPYVISKGPKIETGPDAGKYPVRKVIGQYELTYQVDLWAESKPARHNLHDEFFLAFHTNPNVSGISLQLSDYFDEWVRFDLADITFVDSEQGAQRGEWRVKADVLGNVKAIIETNEFLMEKFEQKFETPAEIAAEAQEPKKLII